MTSTHPARVIRVSHDSLLTPCWREVDSNFRFLGASVRPIGRGAAISQCLGVRPVVLKDRGSNFPPLARWGSSADREQFERGRKEWNPQSVTRLAEPEVRIRLPPAESRANFISSPPGLAKLSEGHQIAATVARAQSGTAHRPLRRALLQRCPVGLDHLLQSRRVGVLCTISAPSAVNRFFLVNRAARGRSRRLEITGSRY
jgi:hypothetical protein